MKPYLVQALYRRLESPTLWRAAIGGARSLGLRYLAVRIDTNDICNLRCPMCALSDPARVPNAPPMDRTRFAKIAAEVFPKTRFLYLSCGTEPLATPGFDELLDVVGRYHVPFTSYCTNAILLRDSYIAATLRNRISEVIVSVDGASAEVYERIRVGASFEKLEERLSALTAALAEHKGPKPALRFNFTAQAENVHELDLFADWARQWKPATLQFRVFRPLSGALKQDDGSGTVVEFRRRMPGIRARMAAVGVGVEVSDVPDAGLAHDAQEELYDERALTAAADASQPDGAVPRTQATPPARIDCVLPWCTLYIKPTGSVQPCPVHPPVGNLFETSFAEIEKGPEMRALRRSLRRDPRSICVECRASGGAGLGD